MKASKLLYCLVLVLIMSKTYGATGINKKCNHGPETTCWKNKIIVSNFKDGIRYTSISDNIILKKIMIGEWHADPNTLAIFKENGEFKMIHSSTLYTKDIIFSGKWDAKDNALWLQYNKAGQWKKYEIEFYELSDAKKDGEKYFLGFDEDSQFRYSFEIAFKNGEEWFGSFQYEFNVLK